MKRLPFILAAVLLAGPALAQPALPVMAIAVERPGAAEGSAGKIDALLAALAEEGRLALNQPDLPVKRVQACGRSYSWEGCVRRWLRKPRLNSFPVRLAVVVERGSGAEARVTCLGPGRRWAHVRPHLTTVDLDRALTEPAGGAYRQRLLACLNAAVNDRGF